MSLDWTLEWTTTSGIAKRNGLQLNLDTALAWNEVAWQDHT